MADEAAQALAQVDRAHAVLLGQSDLQFHLARFAPYRPTPFEMGLARALRDLFRLIGPIAPYIFWGGLLAGALAIAYLVGGGWFRVRPGAASPKLNLGPESWRPAPQAARALLEDADRLAAQGLYEEAAHLILLRSIQDIAARKPRAVQPSLTSRDIAALEALTPSARDTFTGIALAVEESLFGGRPMGLQGFSRCRQAYEAFADAGSWA
jgi:hypothetical protein